MTTALAAAVAVHDISKSYAGIKALSEVSLQVRSGEVHALLGENGAGKSTLIKILAGAVQPDSGAVEIGGRPTTLHSPHDAAAHGLAFVHQDPSLIGTMSLAENMFLGTPHYSRAGITSARALSRRYRDIADQVGLDTSPTTLAEQVPVAQQTLVALGRALARDARVIIMDEPTATFSDVESESLFTIIGDLTATGTAIVYVSHRLEEVLRVADTVTVLKNGRHVTTMPASEVAGRDHLVRLIVGSELADRPSHRRSTTERVLGEPVLQADHLSDGRRVRDASLTVRSGEIVGLTGLVGAGRTELAKMLFGAVKPISGTIRIEESPTRLSSPRQAIRRGLALVPEDRRGEGAIMDMSLRENTTLPILDQFGTGAGVRVVRRARERGFVSRSLDALSVKYASTEQAVKELSGGNQQKVVMAKWTATKARAVICDEPTQGVDVGAKAEIYGVIEQLAATGVGVLLISSEIAEAVAVCDRVLVMREGVIVANLVGADESDVLHHCYGTHDTSTFG